MCINELAYKAWNNPKTNYWFISPTFAQAKDLYRRLKTSLPAECIDESWDTELKIELINESAIEFKSGEVLENLRGKTLHGVVIDEVRDQHPDLWPMVIRPMLTTTKGWAAFVSTPAGYDSFYDLFCFAQSNKDEWDVFQSPSTCNPLFTEEELAASRKVMGEAQFAQEIMAEFRDITASKAYFAFSEKNLNLMNPFSQSTEYSPYLPIVVGMDFNVNPMAWVLGQKKINHIHFQDEIFLRGTDTVQTAQVLAEKVKGHKLGVILIGDATGKAHRTSSVGQTDYDLLCQVLDSNGIKWINLTPSTNPPVKDRVNTVNARLRSAGGDHFVTVNPTGCPELVKDLQRVSWKQNSSSLLLDQYTDHERTHASDAMGYVICQMLALESTSESRPGKLSVIVR